MLGRYPLIEKRRILQVFLAAITSPRSWITCALDALMVLQHNLEVQCINIFWKACRKGFQLNAFKLRSKHIDIRQIALVFYLLAIGYIWALYWGISNIYYSLSLRYLSSTFFITLIRSIRLDLDFIQLRFN